VLPNLFAALKFLESNDDLVFNGVICHYFIKKLQIAVSKQCEWWEKIAMQYKNQLMEDVPL